MLYISLYSIYNVLVNTLIYNIPYWQIKQDKQLNETTNLGPVYLALPVGYVVL
jgi:hypothetical protein